MIQERFASVTVIYLAIRQQLGILGTPNEAQMDSNKHASPDSLKSLLTQATETHL